MDRLVYNFYVYQDGTGKRTERGQCVDEVVRLPPTLLQKMQSKIVADNLFTILLLRAKLREMGLHYWLAGCQL